jgi:hypothetical protein
MNDDPVVSLQDDKPGFTICATRYELFNTTS